MPLLYNRTETAEEIVIIYKYHAVFYIILLAFMVVPPLAKLNPKWDVYLVPAIIGVGILWILGNFRPTQEIRRAMKIGKVETSGSKFSLRKPLTCKIKK